MPIFNSIRPVSLAMATVVLTAVAAQAQVKDVYLVARPFTKSITLPDGVTTKSVPMWGYEEWTADFAAPVAPADSPGPRITLAQGEQLVVHLLNMLPVPTSVVIPGQAPATVNGVAGVPVRAGGRARSFTTEVAPSAMTCGPNVPTTCEVGVYAWTSLRPGTYLYQSGSHVQVQVQMGLYGALTTDATAAAPGTPAEAYPGRPYLDEVVLLYSEIDPTLHQSVAEGKYGGLWPIPATPGVVAPGTPNLTSTFNYKPRYFLVNGDAHHSARAPLVAGAPGDATLIRLLNAGLRTHVPVLDRGDLELVAEDGHPYPYARRQYQVSLLAGKTTDAIWTPASGGTYALFDRTPHLTTDGGGPGGMLVKLTVGGGITANNDQYGARNDKTLVVAAPGVMANDSTITTSATLVADVPAEQGTLSLSGDGSFTYQSPTGYAGPVTFTYTQGGSNEATVTINVSANAAPIAVEGDASTNEDTPAAITLQATDVNSDAITYAIATPPAHGSLSGTAPNLLYTPAANYNGPDSFTFTAEDDLLTSLPATVNVTVVPVNDAPAVASATVPTVEDTPVAIVLQGTDIDGDVLSFTITSPPGQGTLSGAPPSLTYTPRPDFSGTDFFRFVASDGQGGTSPVGTITIQVSPAADPPLAVGDAYTTRYNVTTTLNVLANDRDPDGTPLTINNVPVAFPKCFNSTTGAFVSDGAACAAATGVDKVTINSTANRLTYVPNAGVRRNRVLVFTYQARDASGAVSNAATVTIDVRR